MRLQPGTALYIIACLVVPVAWGLLVVWASNAIEKRLRDDPDGEKPTIEYHI
jgi:hypothetical protein